MQLRHLLPKAMWFFTFFLLAALSVTLPAAGADYQTFTGPFSFTVTIYQPDNAGKLSKHTQAQAGTVQLYLGQNGPEPVYSPIDGEQFCMRFIEGSSGKTVVGLKGLVGASSQVQGAKSDTLVGVGAGKFMNPDNFDSGPAYLSITKGTQTPGGNPTSISLSCVAGGGVDQASNGPSYVWSTKFSLTLKPQ